MNKWLASYQLITSYGNLLLAFYCENTIVTVLNVNGVTNFELILQTIISKGIHLDTKTHRHVCLFLLEVKIPFITHVAVIDLAVYIAGFLGH